MVKLTAYFEARTKINQKEHDAWCAQNSSNIFCIRTGLSKSLENQLKLSEDESIVFRLLKTPRSMSDLIETDLLPQEEMLQLLHSFFKGGVIEHKDGETARHIVPLEIRKHRNALRGGKKLESKKIKKEQLKPRKPASAENDAQDSKAKKSAPPPPSLRTGQRKPKSAKRLDPRKIKMAGSPQQRLAIRTVIENYERLMHKDHYNFLCISPKARDGDIKTAYFSLVKEMHPDNLTRLGIDLPEVHELAKAVFGKLNEAYNTLKDFNRRLEYDQELETGAVNTRMMRSGKVRRSKDAQTQNTMAESYLKKGQYQKAEEHFRLAIEFDDEVPEYHTALAWCVATNPRNRSPKMIQRGKEILSETVKRFHHAEAAYRLGLLCMRDDDYHTALQLFDKTLKMDPDHGKAKKESQVVILRLKEEQEALAAKNRPESGFLSKLFQKNK